VIPIAPRFLARVSIAVLLGAALPAGVAAQLGGTIDIRSGPVAWDQGEARDPLLNGEVAASYGLPRFSAFRLELLGDFGVMSGPAQAATVRWDLGARLHRAGSTAVWLGFALGAAGIGSPHRGLSRLEGGLRRSMGPARVDVWLSRTGFGAGMDGLNQDTIPADTLARKGLTEYTELGSRVAFGFSRYELGVTLTRRIGREIARRTGWELSATWWMAPSIGLVGSAGHSLPQLGFVVPGGRYGTLGLRLALGAGSRNGQSRRTGTDTPSSNTPALQVQHRHLTLRSAPARSAES
jgi:hypothetical protein